MGAGPVPGEGQAGTGKYGKVSLELEGREGWFFSPTCYKLFFYYW